MYHVPSLQYILFVFGPGRFLFSQNNFSRHVPVVLWVELMSATHSCGVLGGTEVDIYSKNPRI